MDRLTDTFYKEADQFIQNLRSFCSSFDELRELDENLYTSQNEIEMARRLGGSGTIPTLFHNTLEVYERQILNRNEDFFLAFELEDSDNSNLVALAQKVWVSGKLDAESKESIWNYVQLLYKLSKFINQH